MKLKIEIVCDISEDAACSTEIEIMEWAALQLGFSDSLTIGNPMVKQKVHLLHSDNINKITIEP